MASHGVVLAIAFLAAAATMIGCGLDSQKEIKPEVKQKCTDNVTELFDGFSLVGINSLASACAELPTSNKTRLPDGSEGPELALSPQESCKLAAADKVGELAVEKTAWISQCEKSLAKAKEGTTDAAYDEFLEKELPALKAALRASLVVAGEAFLKANEALPNQAALKCEMVMKHMMAGAKAAGITCATDLTLTANDEALLKETTCDLTDTTKDCVKDHEAWVKAAMNAKMKQGLSKSGFGAGTLCDHCYAACVADAQVCTTGAPAEHVFTFPGLDVPVVANVSPAEEATIKEEVKETAVKEEKEAEAESKAPIRLV